MFRILSWFFLALALVAIVVAAVCGFAGIWTDSPGNDAAITFRLYNTCGASVAVAVFSGLVSFACLWIQVELVDREDEAR